MNTVTIGIPAHNEEKSIKKILDSLCEQNERNFRIQDIIVLCDGCTDRTVAIAKKCARENSRIKVVADRKQMGKTSRLNWLFHNCETDYLICFDADSSLGDKNVIHHLITELCKEQVGLVACSDAPHKPCTFFGKVVVTHILMWKWIREHLNDANNVHILHGCGYALSKQLYSQLEIPQSVISDDTYVYLKAVQLDYRVRYAKRAVVNYWIPENFSDYMSQSKRFLSSEDEMVSYFEEGVKEKFIVPVQYKVQSLLYSFLHRPMTTFAAFVLQVFHTIRTDKQVIADGKWQPIASTKK